MTASQEFPTAGEPGKMPAHELTPEHDDSLAEELFIRYRRREWPDARVPLWADMDESHRSTWRGIAADARSIICADTIPISRENAKLFVSIAQELSSDRQKFVTSKPDFYRGVADRLTQALRSRS